MVSDIKAAKIFQQAEKATKMWRCTAYKEKLMDTDIHFDKQEKCMTGENNGRFFEKALSESGGPCQEYCLYGNDTSWFCR